MSIASHKDLIVWQKAVELAVSIYKLTDLYPKSELYGLTSQMRRAAVSIASNIAEGRRRATSADFKRFLDIAFGSGAELETQIEIGKQLTYVPSSEYEKSDQLLDEVMRMLNKMKSNLVKL